MLKQKEWVVNMYFVVNLTKQHLVIGDLKFELGPKMSVDLEKIKRREDIINSKDLKIAVSIGKLQIRHDSVAPKQEEVITNYIEAKQPHDVKAIVSDEELEKIRNVVKQEMSKYETPGSESQVNTEFDINALLKQFKDLLSKSSGSIINREGESEVDESDLDIERLSEIHAKSVAKRTHDATVKVEYTEKHAEDDITSNLDDLDELLG